MTRSDDDRRSRHGSVSAPGDGGDQPDVPDDATLFRHARAGDRAAFAAIYARYEPRIKGYLFRLLRDADQAQDLTHDTFVKAMVHLPRTTGRHLRGWLYRIAHNTAVDELRHRHTVREVVEQPPVDRHEPGHHPPDSTHRRTVGDVADLPDRAEDRPEQQVLRAELWATTRDILGRLAPRQRQALVLWHDQAEGTASYAELARRLETTPSGIRFLLHRGREAARSQAQDLLR